MLRCAPSTRLRQIRNSVGHGTFIGCRSIIIIAIIYNNIIMVHIINHLDSAVGLGTIVVVVAVAAVAAAAVAVVDRYNRHMDVPGIGRMDLQ